MPYQWYRKVSRAADLLLKGLTTLSPQDKTNIAAQLIETINKQPDEIIKRDWARMAAGRVAVDEDIILSKITRPKAPRPVNEPVAPLPPKVQEGETPAAETDLIKLLLKYPRYIESCIELTEDHFKNKDLWLILKGIESIRQAAPTAENIVNLLAGQNPRQEQLIYKLSVEALPRDIKPARDIEAHLKALQKAALTRQLKELQLKIKEYPAGAVPLDLLKEQIELQKKIKY